MKKGKIIKRISLAVLLVAALLVGGCAIYIESYYHAGGMAEVALYPGVGYSVQQLQNGSYAFVPSNPKLGLIFYPGGKVEHTAYAPLMAEFASRGVLCVLVEMPCRLAVLDVSAADGILDMYPQVDRWYIGGHSLGGAMAASYVSKHTDSYEGLLLLGAYSTADLSDSALNVISVYGSEDGVMNRKKYDANLKNLPADFHELVIEGGCHAYFGDYGKQKGDGIPTVTVFAQTFDTADFFLSCAG